MAMISHDTIQQVIERNDIVDIISQYVQLKKSGREFKGLCPFHGEKTPSFYVDPDKQVYFCFGCHSGGNVISFIMAIENMDFTESVKYLADRAGIIIKENQNDDRTSILYEINREAARYFYSNLKDRGGLAAYNYLKNRGIEDKTIIKFGLGYSLNKWDGLIKHLESKGYKKEDMLKAGLIIKSKDGDNYFDRYRNRVMFPIFDVRNRVIGFGARALGDGMPKYLNSPETRTFNKSSVLYALNIAKKSTSDHFIIVEGYMDAISLHQAGIDNAVASLGTALTIKQIQLIKRYKTGVIVSYDSDVAGKMATDRGLELLGNTNIDVKVLEIPVGKDPDEFIRSEGVDAFKEIEAKAVPVLEYRIKKACNDLELDKPEDKAKFIEKALNILSEINDIVKRDAYIKYVSELTKISEYIIKSQLSEKVNSENEQKINNKYINGNNRHNIKYDNNIKAPLINGVEESVLTFLLNDKNVRNKFLGELDVDLFKYNLSKKVFEYLVDINDKNGEMDITDLLEICENDDEVSIISKMTSYKPTENTEVLLRKSIAALKMNRMKELIAQKNSLEEIKKLQQEVISIKKQMFNISGGMPEGRGQIG